MKQRTRDILAAIAVLYIVAIVVCVVVPWPFAAGVLLAPIAGAGVVGVIFNMWRTFAGRT